MKFLVNVTPPSIYHGCSTRKTFWDEKFTGKKYLFQYVNMKNGGRRNVVFERKPCINRENKSTELII